MKTLDILKRHTEEDEKQGEGGGQRERRIKRDRTRNREHDMGFVLHWECFL